MIRRAIAALFTALLLAACDAAAPDSAREWPAASPAIWEVTAPDGQKGWLFGTVHALPDGVDWRTPKVDAAFDEAGVLVVEIADLSDTESSFEAFRTRAYSEGLPPLLDRVSPDRRDAVERLVERSGGDVDDYTGMESWAASLVLAGGVRNGDPENGVDRALIASGKPVLGLESFEEQYDLFDRLPAAEQADLLEGVAYEAADNSGEVMLEAWLTGNDRQLDELSNASLLQDAELKQSLLIDRNSAWAVRTAALVEDGRAPFVAVGAAHIVGSHGLLALLEERGYTVRRL